MGGKALKKSWSAEAIEKQLKKGKDTKPKKKLSKMFGDEKADTPKTES